MIADELIVDNFAGGGGASTGIWMATGRHPDIAINHNAEALAMHAANHPETRHLCEDVFKVDPVEVCAGRPVGLAWFSPDCKHFSKAKGGKPKSKKIRGLAWVMVKWAAKVRPRVMFLENVEEFQTWGPLLADGKACPRRKGRTFRNFVARLRNLGYVVEWKELRASDYGAGTIRKRLFLIARCDGRPIVWPAPTHGKPGTDLWRQPWKTAAESIDWSLPCPSIFERKRPLAEATMRRIARGIFKFVINAAEPFIVHTAHGDVSPGGVKRWGNGEHSARKPFGTVTGSNDLAVVVPHVTKFRAGATGFAGDEPFHTITAGGEQARPGTGNAMGLVNATIAPLLTECANASGQRVFAADEPMRTQCGEVKGGHFAAVSAFLAKHYGGNETPGSDVRKPCDTITAVDHHAVVAANVVRHFGQSVGSGPDEPIGTTTAGGGGKTAVAVSHLSKLYGTNIGADVAAPLPTVTSGGNHLAEVRAFLIKYYGNEKTGHSLRDPLHTITSKDRVGLVTIHGEEYVITDIGMRMLEPHELFAAQGFPPDYIIAPLAADRKGKLRPLPKHAQVRNCGNSVCPPMAAALVAANYCPAIAEKEAA